MTTIGYGNTVPTTLSGQWFVGVFGGFFHLCVFVMIVAHVGYISITKVDNFFDGVHL